MRKIVALIVIAVLAYGFIHRQGIPLPWAFSSTGAAVALQANHIAALDASKHVGETTTVCGIVASATYATRSQGKPTFLNLDRAFPNQVFTAVIFDDHRSRFDYAPESLAGSHVCVTGLINLYKGKPEIVVNSPGQISSD